MLGVDDPEEALKLQEAKTRLIAELAPNNVTGTSWNRFASPTMTVKNVEST
jgi:hypothetical protein